MGRRGPAPTPTPLRALRGNPQHRPLNESEPRPPAEKPPACPSWLSKEARAEWRRVVPALHKLGLLAKVDRATIALYCDQWALYVRARLELETYGLTLEHERAFGDGENRRTYTEVRENPALRIMDRAAQRIRQLAQEFGLTVSSRSRIELPGEPEGGEDDEFGRRFG